MSTELEASSRAHTHSRASSSGRLQSSANEAMLAVTSEQLVRRRPRDGQRVLARAPAGTGGRPPNPPAGRRTSARWPSPTGRAGSRGRPIGSSPSNGSVDSLVSSGGRRRIGPGAGAIEVRTVRHDSRARSVQSPRPTGTQVSRRPSGETGMPVASITLSSATRASCSSWIRWIGSTLASALPPVATLRAKDRVISHWLGALVPSMFIRSPSSDWNGFPASPGSGGAMPSCYGDELISRCIGVADRPGPPTWSGWPTRVGW